MSNIGKTWSLFQVKAKRAPTIWAFPARTWMCLSNYTDKKVPILLGGDTIALCKVGGYPRPCLVLVKISCLSITLLAVSCDEGLTFSCSLLSFCSGFCWNEADGVIKTHTLRMKDLENSEKWKLAGRNENAWWSKQK